MMNSELLDLYQEVVIDHRKRSRNFRMVEGATRTAEGFNPLCGDQLTLYVKLVDGVIEDIAFQGSGCAISKASTSLMTAAVKGKKQEEALALFGRFHAMLTEAPTGTVKPEEVGKLAGLAGVWNFRCGSRAPALLGTRCATPSTGKAARMSTEQTPMRELTSLVIVPATTRQKILWAYRKRRDEPRQLHRRRSDTPPPRRHDESGARGSRFPGSTRVRPPCCAFATGLAPTTTKGRSLAEEDISGHEVTCPRHGAKFAIRTGEVVGPPAQRAVAGYGVRVTGTHIQVEV